MAKIRSPYSRLLANPLMPASPFEFKIRLERMLKLLSKYNYELNYIFPESDQEKLIIEKSRDHINSMINIISDVLQQKTA